MNIRIYYDNTGFRLKGSEKVKKVLEKVIRKEGRVSCDLNFVFTGDETIRKINRQFLNHDYFTDVITFDYNEGKKIKGEVYISLDTVRGNSVNYNVSLRQEVLRVMIHGTLHLLGYDDKSEEDRTMIHKLEERWLEEF